jgi:hypothetical protein
MHPFWRVFDVLYASWSETLPLSGKYGGIVHVRCKVSCTTETILSSSQIFTTHKLLTYLSVRHEFFNTLPHWNKFWNSVSAFQTAYGLGSLQQAVTFPVTDKVLKNMFEKIKLNYVYFFSCTVKHEIMVEFITFTTECFRNAFTTHLETKRKLENLFFLMQCHLLLNFYNHKTP